ncbi:MAG: apolipoprotein N-acyltransferase [Sulfurimonas sp.]|jgi:apolipoprotein N-acyltransferase|nr:apolipoprotein N-acyltransferase [Sulfurimonadaceae bacterium]
MLKNSKTLLLGLLSAIFFSAFIYLDHFGFNYKVLNSLLALLAFFMFLYIPKRAVLVAGFFVGLFWFYWIGYSFKYNGVGYLEPFITLAFGVIYMLFFAPLALSQKAYIRAIMLFGLSFFAPMDFNWLILELPLVDSYFSLQKYSFVLLLLAMSLLIDIKDKKLKPLALIPIILAININEPKQLDAPLNIKLIQTDISQDQKWQQENFAKILGEVLHKIDEAVEDGYDVVVFPESALPLFLNEQKILQNRLKELSFHISIVIGSLYKEDGLNYNVTYAFEDGEEFVAKKMVLVPFGEYIPLPSFLKKPVNDYFFAGASDFKTALTPSDITIKGVKFRSAICYEASRDEIYKDNPEFVLAISNNAWFSPSIEPTLQKLLISFFARKYNSTVYHSANYKGTGVIK